MSRTSREGAGSHPASEGRPARPSRHRSLRIRRRDRARWESAPRVLPLLVRFTARSRKWFGLAFLMLVIEAIMSVFQAYPIAYLIDFLKGSRRPLFVLGISDPMISTIAVLTAAVVLVAIFDSLGDSLAEVFLARAGRRLGFNMRTELYQHLQRLSLSFHQRRRTGDMLKRVTSDIEDVEEFVIDSVSDVVGGVLLLIGTVGFLLLHSWQVALLAAVLVPLLCAISNHFSHRIRTTSRRQKARESDLASAAQEMLTSVPVVQTFGQSAYEQRRFEEHGEAAMHAALESVSLEARFSWVIGVLEAVTTAAVVWLGIWLRKHDALSIGTLVLFVILIENMFKPTRKIIKEWATLGKIRASLERVGEVLVRVPAVHDRPGAVSVSPFRGHLQFRHVSFAYRPEEFVPGGPDVPPVLHDVTFETHPGQIVALVGPSGAGKTTIAQLIPRLYDPTDGQVVVDGRDIRGLTLECLRRQIGFVMQETTLFRGSVAHNIAYGRPEATREEILAAARQANADEFIELLPDGYDTELHERASNLSGGQRQRIAIARALLRNAPILILDEPTAGLDTRATATVVQALKRLMKGRTTILISHDLDLIRMADRILVVRHGRIEEAGTHDELAARGGAYASLLAARFEDPKDIVRSSDPAPTSTPVAGDATGEAAVASLVADLPSLSEALDAEAVRPHLQRALIDGEDDVVIERCRRMQVLFEPGDHCMVRYEIRVRRNGRVRTALVCGRVFPDGDRARNYVESTLAQVAEHQGGRRRRSAVSRSVGLAPDLDMALSVFPVDGELPTLVGATDPRLMLDVIRNAIPEARSGRFAPTRCRVEVAHYGREGRCALRYTVREGREESDRRVTLYGKVTRNGDGGRIAAALASLRDRIGAGSRAAIRIPECFGFDDGLRLSLFEALPGTATMKALVRNACRAAGGNGATPPALDAALRDAAGAAAALHASGVDLGSVRSFRDDLDDVRNDAAPIASRMPSLGRELSQILSAVAGEASRSEPVALTPVHGDFTLSQLLFDGTRPGVVDFDTMCLAEPARDLGQFAAYLRLTAAKAAGAASAPGADEWCDRFLSSYVRRRRLRADEAKALLERVRVYELLALTRAVCHSWKKLKTERLVLAMELLEDRATSPVGA